MRSYKNLVQRMEEEFLALEQEAVDDLKESDLEYGLLLDELEMLVQENPFLKHFFDGNYTEPLTERQRQVLKEYQNRMRWKDIRERRHLYFLGHTDAIAYCKKIGAI